MAGMMLPARARLLMPTVSSGGQTPAAVAKTCAADFEASEAKVRK